jgi:hypothetical protein
MMGSSAQNGFIQKKAFGVRGKGARTADAAGPPRLKG